MASKTEQTVTVEDRLRALYQLQTILSEIDRIKQIRGELPLEVSDLEDSIAGLEKRIEKYTNEKDDLARATNEEHHKIEASNEAIARYSEQLNQVSNSREYDALSKEIDFQKLEIELSMKHIDAHKRSIEALDVEIASTKEKLNDLKHLLESKKSELDEIVSETRQEEENLREKAKTVEAGIDEYTLKAFRRIRKNARNGLGIVYVQRNACGGCFNRIPPQRQMEIKMHKKIIDCEYCGRIIIDPALAGVEEAK